MTTDFRALCAELLAAADEYAGMNPYMRLDNAMKTARAALAAPEPPADGEVAETVKWLREETQISWADSCPIAAGRLTRAADLLERLAVPEPPAVAPATWLPMEQAPRDGTKILGKAGDEVAVVYWLSGIASSYWCLAVCGAYADNGEWNPAEWQPIPSTVAVRTIAPIPVSERLPGDQLCWWFESDEDGGYGSNWTLLRIRGSATGYTHWLPANALPLPAGGAHE
jgi:hypothetical protein